MDSLSLPPTQSLSADPACPIQDEVPPFEVSSPVRGQDTILPDTEIGRFFEPFTLGKNEHGADVFLQDDVYMCGRLDVESKFRSESNKSRKCFIRVSFQSGGQSYHVDLPFESVNVPIPRSGVATWFRRLLEHGFGITHDPSLFALLQGSLRTYILRLVPPYFTEVISQPGIHDWQGRKIFIGQNGTVYGEANQAYPIKLDDDQNFSGYVSNGTFAASQKILQMLEGNPLQITLIGFALDSVSIGLRPEAKSRGFQLVGESHCGKTTSAKVVSSLFGHPEETLLQVTDSTEKGLNIIKTSRRNLTMVLDEILQNRKQYSQLVYGLVNEGHSTKGNGGHGNVLSGSLQGSVLLTSEHSIEECFPAGKGPLSKGILNRLINVPADSWTYGAFEDLHDFANGADFSMALEKAVYENYGHIGWKYVMQFMLNPDGSLNQLEGFRVAFRSACPHKCSDPVEESISRYFTDAAASAAYGIQLGILPWNQNDVFEAVGDVMRRGLKFHSDTQKPVAQRFLCAVRDYVMAHHSEMRQIRSNDIPSIDCYGFLPRGNTEIFLHEKHIGQALRAGMSGNLRTDTVGAVKALADNGWFLNTGKRKGHHTTRKVLWKGGGSMPIYNVSLAKVRNFKG